MSKPSTDENTHDQYTKIAIACIETALGFFPQGPVIKKHLPFMRALVINERKGIITKETFVLEMDKHNQNLRNEYIEYNGWMDELEYGEKEKELYETFLPQFKQDARQRLCDFMGYEPDLQYSLHAELVLREFMHSDKYYSEMPYGPIDYKAATITRYRHIYLEHGKQYAEASHLIGVMAFYQIKAYEEEKKL